MTFSRATRCLCNTGKCEPAAVEDEGGCSETDVYWTESTATGKRVMRTPKRGGAKTVIATPSAQPM